MVSHHSSVSYNGIFSDAGDKPELVYPEAAAELRAMGHESTLSYVAAAASAVLQETGLLPHVNAGVMQRADVDALRLVSASQGLMLESTAASLMALGGAHYGCPDKVGPSNFNGSKAAPSLCPKPSLLSPYRQH